MTLNGHQKRLEYSQVVLTLNNQIPDFASKVLIGVKAYFELNETVKNKIDGSEKLYTKGKSINALTLSTSTNWQNALSRMKHYLSSDFKNTFNAKS